MTQSLSVVTLNVKGLTPIKRQIGRLDRQMQTKYLLYVRDSLQIQRHKKVEHERKEKDRLGKQSPKESRGDSTNSKIDFKSEKVIRHKERLYIYQ